MKIASMLWGKTANFNIHNSMITGQTPCADEDHLTWLKADEKLANWPFNDAIFSNQTV